MFPTKLNEVQDTWLIVIFDVETHSQLSEQLRLVIQHQREAAELILISEREELQSLVRIPALLVIGSIDPSVYMSHARLFSNFLKP